MPAPVESRTACVPCRSARSRRAGPSTVTHRADAACLPSVWHATPAAPLATLHVSCVHVDTPTSTAQVCPITLTSRGPTDYLATLEASQWTPHHFTTAHEWPLWALSLIIASPSAVLCRSTPGICRSLTCHLAH